MKLTDHPEFKRFEAELGAEEVMNRLIWIGQTARHFEREFGRKPTKEDWINIVAVLGGEHG